jgi:decaprenylphospho-beta-D-ribofuranose 2-oxidase
VYTKRTRHESVSGWGNYPKSYSEVFRAERQQDLLEFIKSSDKKVLPRGGGTSYGDASLNEDGIILNTKLLNKMLSFDNNTGILHCQSGVTLKDIVQTFVAKGWFLNVTPGTMNATVGGCIACAAHGKNWRAGAFSNYVVNLTLAMPNGELILCDMNNHSDLFLATLGGMGMTGVILDATIILKKIQSSNMDVETIRFANIKELFLIQKESMQTHEYLFSWFDSLATEKKLGRGVLQRANHSTQSNDLRYCKKRKMSLPFHMPSFTINRLSVTMFNASYYLSSNKNYKSNNAYITDFFYPLDGLINWNRIYGKKGFLEYQFAIPYEYAFETIEEILKIISTSKLGSFIAAIKPIGKSRGTISFPMDGITLAIDFAYSIRLFSMLDTIDDIVLMRGGRVYLSKDSRLNSDRFSQMYSESLIEWDSIREKYNLKNNYSSIMFSRLLGNT